MNYRSALGVLVVTDQHVYLVAAEAWTLLTSRCAFLLLIMAELFAGLQDIGFDLIQISQHFG